MGRRSRLFLGIRTWRDEDGAGEEGFSLLEVVVALAVLLVVVVPTALLLQSTIGQASTSRERLTALSLAEQCVEKLDNTGPPLTAQGVPETDVAFLESSKCAGATPLVVSTVTYAVHAQFTWTTSEGDHPDLCTSGSVPSVLELHVWVTWRRTQKVTDTTVIDYPPPGLPTDGFLAVQADGDPAGDPPTDAKGSTWATRVQGIPVTMTKTTPTGSPFSASLHPDSYGCVFQQVPPGTYTVSLADPSPGGVPATPSWSANEDETTTPVRSSLVVNVGLVTLTTFQYDEGSLASLSYPTTTATDGGLTCPSSGTIRCIVSGQAPAQQTDPGATPVAELSVRTTSGWAVARPPDAVRLVASACAGTRRCVAVGYGRSGSAYLGASDSSPTTSVDFVADPVPSGVTALFALSCPAPTACYAAGTGAGGAVLLSGTVTASAVTWSLDGVPPGVGRISALVCPAATTCYAATSNGHLLSLSSASWESDTVPTTATFAPSSLSALACTSTATCYAVGTRKASSLASELSLTAAAPTTWVHDSGPTTLRSLTSLVCVSNGSGASCHAVGVRATGGATVAVIASLSSSAAWQLDTPAAEGTIGAITCPSATVCAAVGTTTSGAPLLLWRTATATFTSETLPAGTASVTGVACGNASHCFVAGTTSEGTTGAAIVSGAGSTWKLDPLPGSPVSISGIACGGDLCEAPGASETGALFLEGTPTGTGWTIASPSHVGGLDVTGVPVAVTNSGLETVRPQEVSVPAATAVVTRIGPLFPFQSGYSVAATECAPLTPSTLASAVPGTTSSVTLPMGLLALRVLDASGTPDSGATVTAAPSCTTTLTPPAGKTNPASFALLATGPLGLSQIAVPYGTYTVTVTHAGHTATRTIGVTPTSIVVTGVARPVSTPAVVVET